MFTGLVEHVGRVAEAQPHAGGIRLRIDPAPWACPLPAAGDSIAVAGCCLTVVEATADSWSFDVIRQTLDATTLGRRRPGDRVNLERSATPATLLGGHLVQGHIDGVGTVMRVDADATQWRVRIAPPPALAPLVVDRGSICVDGVSLTVAALDPTAATPWFEVALIPTTLQRTTLRDLRPGEEVNLESDCIVRAVAHLMRWRGVSA